MFVIKRSDNKQKFNKEKILQVISYAVRDYNIKPEKIYNKLYDQISGKEEISTEEIQRLLIQITTELITTHEPYYTFIAARLFLYDLYKKVSHVRGYKIKEYKDTYKPYNKKSFLELIKYGVNNNIYNNVLLEEYTEDQINELARYIKPERDELFTYVGIKTLADRYLVKNNEGRLIELPQEMYMLISMFLALPEDKSKRLDYVKSFYDVLSNQYVTVATPTLLNARKSFSQLSSCFVLTIDDDLHDMFYNIQKMANISKYAGGIGAYIGKLRSTNSSIRNFKGACSGVIPYIRIINDTMVYVDQLGMRKGSASITLDIWHKDILDFLEIKTNAGDERKKAHDIHPAVSIPNLFMERLEKALYYQSEEKWTLFDPYIARKYITKWLLEDLETELYSKDQSVTLTYKELHGQSYDKYVTITFQNKKIDKSTIENFFKKRTTAFVSGNYETGDNYVTFYMKDLGLEDFYGHYFNFYYKMLEFDKDVDKKEIDILVLWKRLMTVCFETGEPYIFFRDTSNKCNPNKHIGIVYSSNLCHEIIQTMKVTIHENNDQYIEYNNEKFNTSINSGFVPVCNLASLNLGKVYTDEKFKEVIPIVVRMLDNVIDLNYYTGYEMFRTNKLFRAIGLGVSNYHYCLVKNNIMWEDNKHIEFADMLFEKIAYYTLQASLELAKEKGKYELFDGSDWSKGIFFGRDIEQIHNESKAKLDWKYLYKQIKEYGIRNGYLLALMPTGSTSLILGATPSIDPIFAKYYKEENMSGILPQVPPEINKYFWHYKTAYSINQEWVIKAAIVRQKWIDQAQSLNLFIDPVNIDGYSLSKLYIDAWKGGLKTIYYMRSKSLVDVDECESCST